MGGKTYKLAIKYYDDESTPARGAQLAERLIKQDGIKFMLGPYSSGLTKAIAPVTEKFKIPMVEGNGASRSLFTKGYKYLFAVLTTSEHYLSEAINLAAQQAVAQGRKASSVTVALAMENDPFSQDVRLGILDNVKKYGMKVVIDDKLPPEINDMTATLNKVRALKPDILVVSGHSKGAALIIKQKAQMKIEVPMLAITHCESAKVTDQKKFGKNAEGTLCAAQWAPSMAYKDDWFGSAWTTPTPSRRPMATCRPIRRPNRRLPCWSGPMPWPAPGASIMSRSAMRWPPPGWRPSMAISNSIPPEKTSPSR